VCDGIPESSIRPNASPECGHPRPVRDSLLHGSTAGRSWIAAVGVESPVRDSLLHGSTAGRSWIAAVRRLRQCAGTSGAPAPSRTAVGSPLAPVPRGGSLDVRPVRGLADRRTGTIQ
jgi:hypothetical protein